VDLLIKKSTGDPPHLRSLQPIIINIFDPSTQFSGNEKITLCYANKYKNQAGINLTPPSPSQNSHAVRWHSTAESDRRVAEIKKADFCVVARLISKLDWTQ